MVAAAPALALTAATSVIVELPPAASVL